MKRFQFRTAIRNAMQTTSSTGPQDTEMQTMVLPPSPPGPPSLKQRLFRLIRAPLALGRRFLVGAVDMKVEVALKKLDNITSRLDTLHPKTDHILNRADIVIRSFDAVQTSFAVQGGQTDDVIRSLGALQQGLATQGAQSDDVIRSLGAVRQSLTAQGTQAADVIRSLGALQQGMISQSERTDDVIRSLGTVQHTLDSRLHQIDIKVRGPLAYDDATWAVRTVDGYVLVPKSARELYVLLADAPAEGLEPGTHRCLKALVDPGMTVVDVGANVGMLSLAFARSVGALGKVYAFEAEPAFQDLLVKSFALNGVPWVELRRQAAGREAGKAVFHVSPIAGHSSLYGLPADEAASSQQISVDVVALDEALAHVAKVDLVKIDVEGAELDVLAGMKTMIARNPDLAVVAEFGPSHLARVGQTPEVWFQAFEAHGLAGFAIDESNGDCRRVEARDVENVVSVNIVFARPGTQTAARLERMGSGN